MKSRVDYLKEAKCNFPKHTIISSLLSINKPRAQFFVNILCAFLCSDKKINFKQLSDKCGKSEKYFYRNFAHPFDFSRFNYLLANQYLSNKQMLALTTCHISNSGNISNCKNSPSIKTGMSFTSLSIVDLENKIAMHLEAHRLPSKSYMNKWKLSKSDWSLSLFNLVFNKNGGLSKYLFIESCLLNRTLTSEIQKMGLYLIGFLDANTELKYPSLQNATGKKGRPMIYADTVDLLNLDSKHFRLVLEDDQQSFFFGTGYIKKLLLKASILVCQSKQTKEQPIKLFYTTDTDVNPAFLIEQFEIPSIIKPLYENAKDFTGLCDCLSNKTKSSQFHINASLSAINIALAEHWLSLPIDARGTFNMSACKKFYQEKTCSRKRAPLSINFKHVKKKSIATKQLVLEPSISKAATLQTQFAND